MSNENVLIAAINIMAIIHAFIFGYGIDHGDPVLTLIGAGGCLLWLFWVVGQGEPSRRKRKLHLPHYYN